MPLRRFVQFMDFLNSENQTIYGPGLGLEVGTVFGSLMDLNHFNFHTLKD